MLIGWVYPHQMKCGISIYAREYLETKTLRGVTLSIDPAELLCTADEVREKMERCDIIHVQYEAGSLYRNKKDLFKKILSMVKKPLMVSLHEVYEQDPFAFPRYGIAGVPPLRWIRRVLYDRRHPVQTCQMRHLACQFGADIITVPYRYHAGILVQKKIDPNKIRLLELPVPEMRSNGGQPFGKLPKVHLGAVGFINPAFDYQLLFQVLDGMQRPWTFTWMGGLRDGDDDALLLQLRDEIDRRAWKDRFVITGWLSDDVMDNYLAELDIVLALFIFRSSSASLARALGAKKPVIATELPLTKELAESNGADTPSPLLITGRKKETVIDTIERLCSDVSKQERLLRGISQFCMSRDYESSAKKLMALYEEMRNR